MYVEGRLRTRKWQDQQNTTRFTTEVVANEVHILSHRNNGLADDVDGNGGSISNFNSDYVHDYDVSE